jgi:hypothetical protein
MLLLLPLHDTSEFHQHKKHREREREREREMSKLNSFLSQFKNLPATVSFDEIIGLEQRE